MNELREQVCAEKEYMINLRRDFHRHPELSLQERRTAGVIEQELERFEISHTRIGATGVLGILRGTQSGSGVVALRADIDALPIQETNDVEYRSQTDGIMHACGHDAHTASLLGAAKVLSQNRDRFGGELRFLFQPAEETGKGAPDFINAGALDGAERILGLHSAPDLPLGTICFVPNGDYVKFMEQYTGKHYPAGAFLDLEGQPVGRHCGAVRYTLGQRKGLGLAMGEPVYVCGKDMAANTVTVGPENALYSSILLAEDMNWISIPQLKQPMRVKAKTRYRQAEQWAAVYPEQHGRVRLEFDVPQRAVTVGQAVVLYDGDVVVGGGTICQAPPTKR